MSKLLSKSRSVLLASMLAVASSAAVAVPVLDQDNSNVNAGFCTGWCEWQQTVTAGMNGQLTGVVLYGGGSGEVRIALGEGWQTGGWAADVNASFDGNIIDLTSFGIVMNAGDKFIIDLTNTSGGLSGTFNQPVGDLYHNGGLFSSDWGIGYKTYVESNANTVPEPASLTLLGLGLLGAAAARRRKA